MRALVLTALLLLAAWPTAAMDLPPRALAVLAAGRPFVEVRPDPDGASGQIRAAIDISAPQTQLWDLMTDCALVPKFVAALKSCRVVERGPGGAWDVREQVTRATLFPSVRTVFRADFDPPRRMRFHATGGDMKVFEGEWRLEPQGDNVRVTYEARAAAPFSVPGWLARAALRHDVTAALLALRREAQGPLP